MNGLTTTLDQLWRSHSLPMWLALAAAVFFGLIVLVTLFRAEKSVANGALTVITLLAIGVAAAATLRGSQSDGQVAASTAAVPSAPPFAMAALPALSCLDEMAGDLVLAACEKVLFGSADSVAAAVSASAARLSRLTGYGDVAAANKVMTPELATLRRALERDRYGLVAYVLQSRERCMPENCAAYASLTDRALIASNMTERVYEGLITRYAASWNAPPVAAAAAGVLAGLPASVPSGKPTAADFPSASSIPPISIMTDSPAPAPRAPATAKKTPAQKAAARPQPPTPPAPAQLAPPPAQADN